MMRSTILAAVSLAVAPGTALAGAGPAQHPATGNLGGLSCPTASLCYAAGASGQRAVVDTLKGGKQVKSQKASGLEDFIGISCPSTSFCQLTGDTTDGVATITYSHGAFGKLVRVSFSAWQVSCPAAGQCVIAGFGDGSTPTLQTAVVSHGKVGKPHARALHKPVTDVTVYGLSCASISACEATGTVDYSGAGGIGSFYAGLGRGASIGTVHTLQFTSTGGKYLENGVACPHGSSTCYVAAGNHKGNLLLSLRIGGSTLSQVSTPSMLPIYISCDTLRYCTAAGAGNGAVPAIQSFLSGHPGKELDFNTPPFGAFGETFSAVARPSQGTWVALATTAGASSTTVLSGAPA